MTFDPTKPVQTRDGRPARIICTDREYDLPIIALTKNSEGYDMIIQCHTDGFQLRNKEPDRNDLVNVPRTMYLNLYMTKDTYHTDVHGWLYDTASDAEHAAMTGAIMTAHPVQVP